MTYRRGSWFLKTGKYRKHTSPPFTLDVNPISISDFENDIYTLNGVEKEFSDLWNEGGWGTPTSLTSDGLELTGTVTNTMSGVSSSVYCTTDLYTALQQEHGFTALIDVSATVIDDSIKDVYIQFGPGNHNWLGWNINDPGKLYRDYLRYQHQGNPWETVSTSVSPPKLRVAASFGPDGVLISYSGQTPVRYNTGNPEFDVTDPAVWWYFFVQGNNGRNKVTAKRLVLYPLITNTHSLMKMSSARFNG